MRLLSVLLLFIFCQCSKTDQLTPQEQLEKDIKVIEDYLADNGLVANSTSSGLHYIITQEGTGGYPSANSTVKIYYKGYFTDKKVFDQTSAGSPISYPLSVFIKGWQEGIPLFKKGGKGILLIPSSLAYGPGGTTGIPPNTVLIFDIELLDFY